MNLQERIKKVLREEDYSPAGKEITPNKVVIHKSNPVWRENILKTGLQVSAGECYKTYVGYGVKCKPAIFATNSTNKRAWFDSTYDDDIWEINTEMIPDVKWYKDRHFESRSKHIVTFQDIPKESLSLKYEGTGSGDHITWDKNSPNLYESIRRILKEETLRDSLLELINTDGFKKAAKAVGGGKRLMKILDLNDEELDEFIYQYLTNNLYPDYNWGTEDEPLKQQIKRNIKSYGHQTFYIDDVDAYSYFGEWDGYDYLSLLVINRWVIEELTSLFGDKWIPTFKRWFEDNSGLEVREIDLEGRFLHEY